jgi:C-terminal processing protease CtpA/Prc
MMHKGGGGNGDVKDGKGNKAGVLDSDNRTIRPKEVTEVSIVETVPKKGPGVKKIKIEKIKKKTEKSKFGYYGIGVYIGYSNRNQVLYDGQIYEGVTINTVTYGNPAYLAGFRQGDVMFMINGKQYSPSNDTRGNSSRELEVGVKRGDDIIFIKIRTEWVETDDSGKP